MTFEDEIADLIDKLTTNGRETLDKELIKKLKGYCKTLSQKNDETSYDYVARVIFRQMEKNHAQIRYGCLLVIEYLFEKAHLFRQIVATKKISKLFKLCFDLSGFNQRGDPTPSSSSNHSDSRRSRNNSRRKNNLLPAKWAKKLRLKAAQVVKYWSEEFGRSYSTLQCGLRFLELNDVDFEDPELEAQRIEERLRLRTLNQLEQEYSSLEENCDNLITQVDNLFELLIPRFEFIDEDNQTNDGNNDNNFNFRPMRGLSFNIFLNRQVEIIQDDSNCDIISSLKDFCDQLHSIHQNELLPFSDKLSKLELTSARLERLKAKDEDLRARILTIVCKSNDMKIVTSDSNNRQEAADNNDDMDNGDEEDDDDDDFEDVHDEEADYIMRMMRLEEEKNHGEKPKLSYNECGPSTVYENDVKVENKEKKDKNIHIKNDALQCRALLPSGRLCPRQDKKNCPFHGKIIQRDDEGLPIDVELRRNELNHRAEQKTNEWRDPNYLKLLSERTGIDLTGNSFRKRKRYPNLIDIKVEQNTPRKRLMRKFGKKTLQQLAGVYDS